MPTYDFACPAGHEFERFYRKISDAPTELPCPVCGQAAVRQLSGGAGLIFKGSGFYITDYGKDGKKQPSKPSSPTESGKSEVSPDATAGSKPAEDAKGARRSTSSEGKPGAPEGGAKSGKRSGASE
jgi:putative FmdB family regulatory protein